MNYKYVYLTQLNDHFMETILSNINYKPSKIVKTQYQKRNKSYQINTCRSKT